MKRKSNKVLLSIIISAIIISISFFVTILTSKNEKSSTVVKTFESNYGSFEVEVPKDWKVEYQPFYEATEDIEGSPDGGIQIQIDAESFIFITVSRSRIYYNGIFQENMQTYNGVTAKAYSYNNDGRINEIELTDSIGVIIKCNNDIYDKYKRDIINLVKNIKIR